ncbi:MAG: hypothetical protein PVJ69_14110 [Desulfobacteraceae bacterium]|jgi:hypothetical protein
MAELRNYRYYRIWLVVFVVLWLGLQMAGCASDSYTAKGAARGAGSGAVAGAVGGLVSALVFGGDPVESAARGAVYAGAASAAAGAMAGRQVDKQIQQQREAQLAKVRQEIGDDAFEGLEALADCKHDVALRQAAKAQQSKNPNYALAGLWLEVLNYGDQRDEVKARSLFPKLVEKDWDINSESQAEDVMRKSLNRLMDIRQEYNMPRVCK